MKNLKDRFQRLFWHSLFTSFLFICVGVLLIIKPSEVIQLISIVIGIGIIIAGIFAFIKYLKLYKEQNGFYFDLVYGIICIVAGTLLIFNPNAVASILPLILGVWMLINSAFKIQYVLDLKKYQDSSWIWTLVLTILTLACGILFIFNPFRGAEILMMLLGITIIVYAIMDVINMILLRKKGKEFLGEITTSLVIEEK